MTKRLAHVNRTVKLTTYKADVDTKKVTYFMATYKLLNFTNCGQSEHCLVKGYTDTYVWKG